MNSTVWLSLLGAWLLAGSVQAQYRVRHYTLRDGLAQGGAYFMLKDSRRYLWFLSQDGLTRFDGQRFVNYVSSADQPDLGPTGDAGSGLVEAPNGDLWFGTEQGLNHYVRATDRFVARFARNRKNQPVPSPTHVFDVDSTFIWYINEAEGLLRLNWRTGRRTLLTDAIRHDPPLENHYVQRRPTTDEIWLLLPDNGLLGYNYRTGQTRSFFSRRPDNQTGSPRSFSALYLDPSGLIWLAYSDVLVALNPATGQTATYPMPPSKQSSLAEAISTDPQGNLWIGADGVYVFSRDSRRWINFLRNNPHEPNSLANNSISELMVDREGIIWVNTDPIGVDQLTPDSYEIRHYDIDPIRPPTLSDHNILHLAEDRRGRVWIGTTQGGIDVLDPRTNRVRHHAAGTQPGALPSKTIYALYIDGRNRVWVGSGQNFCRYNEQTNTFVRLNSITSDSLPGNHRAVCVREGPNGRLFVGTYEGLYRLDPVTNRFRLLASPGVRFTRAMYYDRQRRYLIASRRHRDLVCYEVRGDSLRERYSVLPTLSVQAVTPDADSSRLWAATANGLYLLRIADGKILRQWHEKDGLPHRVVYSALPDQTGQYWLSTNRGLAVLNPHTGHIRRVRAIEPTEFNNDAYLRSRSGELYFGGVTGLYRFDPVRQMPRHHRLTVNLTGLLIDDQPARLASNVTELGRLSLQPDQRTLTLQFGAIDYFSGGQNRYRYRLTGYDRDWVESGTINTVRYPKLPPGEYVFEVLAADAEGRWMDQPRRLALTVVPPFWRTGWFVVGLLGLTGGLAYVGFRTYVRGRLRRQRREFLLQAASQRAERERLARDLHDHIGPDLVALKLQLEAAREDSPNPTVAKTLDRVIGQANHLIVDVRQVSHALMPVGLQQGLVSSLNDYVEQLNHVASAPEINFTHDLGNSLPDVLQQTLLPVAKELINNALKHAQATLIDVELFRQGQAVQLTVSDNGRGYTLGGNESPTGIGLRNIRDTVRQLGGAFATLEKPTGGMVHRVVIPV